MSKYREQISDMKQLDTMKSGDSIVLKHTLFIPQNLMREFVERVINNLEYRGFKRVNHKPGYFEFISIDGTMNVIGQNGVWKTIKKLVDYNKIFDGDKSCTQESIRYPSEYNYNKETDPPCVVTANSKVVKDEDGYLIAIDSDGNCLSLETMIDNIHDDSIRTA